MRSSETRRIAKRACESSLDPCLCAVCGRPIGDEVKHCVFDDENGSFVLCDPCYVRDERRYGWEHRGNPFPQKRALSRGR